MPVECMVASSGWGQRSGGVPLLRDHAEYYGFRFVELSYSYTRVPEESFLRLWGVVTEELGLRWSLLVPRRALEQRRLDWRGRRFVLRLVERAEKYLGDAVEWYVLRVPVNIEPSGELLAGLERLIDEAGLRGRLVLEAPAWSLEALREAERLGAVAASTDSPLGLRLLPPRGGVMHFRLLGHRLWRSGPYPPQRLLRSLEALAGVEGLEKLYLVAATGKGSVEDATMAWLLLHHLGVCSSRPRRAPQFVEAKLYRFLGIRVDAGLGVDEEE